MATELLLLLLLLPALVLDRLRMFVRLDLVRTHRAYLAHRAHLDPHPDPDLKLHLHLVLPWYQLNQLIDPLYKPV